ncbi:MAG: glycerate kinase [Limnohabitans sp.]
MNFNKILVPLAVIVLTIGAWRQFGWPGIAMAAGGVVMWVLLHFTRLMHILKKAAERPIGHVASAVMLNAKLRKGMTLMHVIAMTRSLGALQTPKDEQPEVFHWTDNGQSTVACTFLGGKLQAWTLTRPVQEAALPDVK